MPKKRKRHKSSSAKPPLTFAASPINIVHNLPSPVFGADHPLTADVVPVELSNYPWVQPEFNRLDAEDARKRSRRTKGLKANSRGVVTNDTENNMQTRQTASNSKFVPLKFTCDKDNSVESVLDDITDFEENCENPSIVNSKEFDIVNTPKAYTGLVLRGNGQGVQAKRISEDYSISDDNLRKTKQHAHVGTQKRPKKSRRLEPAKRLFSIETDISKQDTSYMDGQTVPHIAMTGLNNDVTRLVKNLSICSDNNENVTPFQSPSVPCDYGSISTPVQERRSMRIRNKTLFDVANSTLLGPLNERHFTVLVPDTPEADYGLSAQERRLKECRRNKIHHSADT